MDFKKTVLAGLAFFLMTAVVAAFYMKVDVEPQVEPQVMSPQKFIPKFTPKIQKKSKPKPPSNFRLFKPRRRTFPLRPHCPPHHHHPRLWKVDL